MPFRDRHGNHARSETDTAIGGIYDSVLARGYSLHVTVAVQRKGILAFARESAGEELRRVARLERHLYRGFSGAERIFRDPVYLFERNLASILPSCVIAVGDVHNIVAHVLANHEPWASAQSETFALSYGVEPVTAVFADFLTCFYLDHRSRTCAEMALDEVVVVDLA